jgi:hypothetical protein
MVERQVIMPSGGSKDGPGCDFCPPFLRIKAIDGETGSAEDVGSCQHD